MRFPLLSPGKYIYITTFFPKDPKVFYKNIHTNHFPTGVQSLMRHRVAARGKWYTGLCKFIAGGKILPKDRGANPYPYDCQELTHTHRQQTEAWFQSAHAEMSLSTFTGKGYLGQIWNTEVMKTWSSLTKEISHVGIPEQGLDAWNSCWLGVCLDHSIKLSLMSGQSWLLPATPGPPTAHESFIYCSTLAKQSPFINALGTAWAARERRGNRNLEGRKDGLVLVDCCVWDWMPLYI